jgi:hypothetical protein
VEDLQKTSKPDEMVEGQQDEEDEKGPELSLDLSLFGSVDLLLSLEGKLKQLRFDLSSSVGRLALPRFLPEPLSIRDLNLRGDMDTAARSLSVQSGSLSLAREKAVGPRLNFSLALSGAAQEELLPESEFLSGDLEITGSAALENLALSEFHYYWPETLAPGAKSWVVKNIPAGMTKSAQADIKLSLGSGETRQLELLEFYGQLAYEDMEIHYLRPLPEIRGVTGTAEITPQGMTFHAGGGQVDGGLSLSQTLVVISGFDQERQAISIESRIEGPLPAALAIIDHERLDLLSGLGLDPADTAGQAEGALHFDFPLLADLRFADVTLGVQAEITEAAAADLVLGQDLTEGTLTLDVDQESMTLKGNGILGGVPVEDVIWREVFSSTDPLEREITTRIPKMTVKELDAFGLDLHDFLGESFSGNLRYRSESGGKSEIFVTADVTATELRIDPLPWVKPSGEKGTAKVHVSLQDHEPRLLHELTIASDLLSLSASGEFDPESRGFRRLQTPFVSFARNRLENLSSALPATAWKICLWSGPAPILPLKQLTGPSTWACCSHQMRRRRRRESPKQARTQIWPKGAFISGRHSSAASSSVKTDISTKSLWSSCAAAVVGKGLPSPRPFPKFSPQRGRKIWRSIRKRRRPAAFRSSFAIIWRSPMT